MKRLFYSTLLCTCCLAAASTSSTSLVFVQFNCDDYETTQTWLEELAALGVTPRHVIAPNEAIVDAHGLASNKLRDEKGRWTVVTAEEALAVAPLARSSRGLAAYNHLVMESGKTECVNSPGFKNCINDGGYTGDSTASGTRTSLANKLESQYLIGSIAVGIYLMESTGPQENWWSEAEQETFNEIVEGLSWLAEEGLERGAKVVWVFAPMETISTSQEPISGRSMPYWDVLGWHFDWLNNVFTSHGQPTEWDGAYGLANQLRRGYKTNWAVEIVVAMDENDADHKFSDYQFAYVTRDGDLAGPFVIMTYNNDSWEPEDMNSVTAHETSHVFGTSDEYYLGGDMPTQCHDSDGCGPQNSYLQTNNGNCEFCNGNPVDCYMRGSAMQTMCSYTPPELGWRDYYLSNNQVMDPVDRYSSRYMYIQPVAAGDIIRLYDVQGRFQNVLAVTADQVCNSAVFFEGVNHSNDVLPAGNYYASRNGVGYGNGFQLGSTTPGVLTIPRHVCSSDLITYRTPDFTLSMRHTIYDSSGNLYSRPRFDVMTKNLTTINANISGYPDGIYTSTVYGHRSDGWRTNLSTLTFINYICGDLDGDSLVTGGDLTVLVNYLFVAWDPLPHPAAADLDRDGVVTMGDMTLMIDHLYISFTPLECRHSLAKYVPDWLVDATSDPAEVHPAEGQGRARGDR